MIGDEPTLVPLPAQPEGVGWPTVRWPVATAPLAADLLVDHHIGDVDRLGTTYAVLVVWGGELVIERYAGALPHWDREDEPVGAETPLLSWSMAKSFLHAVVGLLVADGLVDLDEPAAVPEWSRDARSEITLAQLLEMRDGLEFNELYQPELGSDVVEMLFGAGQEDVAGFAAGRPLAHEPGSVFNYSSGTSNIVARIVGDVIAAEANATTSDSREAAFEAFIAQRIFEPLGMDSATVRFDASGTFIGSSYVFATARDFARFGLWYLRGGVWDAERLLPAGWVDGARTWRSQSPITGRGYGRHWWVVGDERGSFWASGYQGQSIMCVPSNDLVVVRLGLSSDEASDALFDWRLAIAGAFDLPVSGGERPGA